MPSTPKRILILETNQDGTVGGSHQALYDLAVNLDPARFQPVLAFYEENVFADRLRGLDFEVHVLTGLSHERSIRLGHRGRVRKAVDILFTAPYWRFRFLKKQGIDLLHLNNSPMGAMDDWLPAARLAGVPCISNAMGDALLPATRKGRLLLPLYDKVIAISQHVAEGVERQGVPADRIELVHLGVDVDDFRARRTKSVSEVRADLGIDADRFLAVMAGNIREWKGQHVVIEAMSRLDPAIRRRLLVAFAGAVGEEYEPYYRKLTDAVQRYGLQDQVMFLGSRSDLPDLLGAADLAVHASQIPEPFGLVILEALAVDTPVVAGMGGGPSEMLTEDCGILWDTGSPAALAEILTALIVDRAKLKRLGTNAQARARLFDASRWVEGVQRVYGEAIGASNGASV